MKEVILDFETANGVVDLATVGSTAYAKHWATEILCLVYDGHLWTPDFGEKHFTSRMLKSHARNPETVFIAHNAGFEKDIWRFIMVPWFGFPDIPNERWHDTMSSAALRGLPQGLDKLLLAMGLPGKDRVGAKLTFSLSKINKKTLYFDRRLETLQRVYEYCRKDFSDELAVHQKLGYLPPKEHYVWLLDQEINEQGLGFDLGMARGAMQIYEQAASQMVEEFRQITGFNPTQLDKFKAWLGSQGLVVDKLDKTTIAELLGDDEDEDNKSSEYGTRSNDLPDLPDNVKRALFLRGLVGSSSVTKYRRILGAADGETQRICRLLSYHGAGTGRWAGRLLNPHNMPRGIVRRARAMPAGTDQGSSGGGIKLEPPDPEILADAIRTGDPGRVVALGLVKDDGTPAHVIEILASALRNTVVPAPGKKFLVSDWSNIEARLVLALAGQQDKLELIAAGKDPYLDMASLIYHRPVTKADVEMRQTGKNTVLGCGFGMGWRKFKERYCPKETDEFAQQVIKAYRKNWASKIPKMWNGLEMAALKAIHPTSHRFYNSPQTTTVSHGIDYRVEGSWLVGHCPDGSCLYYYRPTVGTRTNFIEREVGTQDWGQMSFEEYNNSQEHNQFESWLEDRKDGKQFECRKIIQDVWRYQVSQGKAQEDRIDKGHWVWAYGALLAENYVQHMARQLLCRSLHLCKQADLPVVLHNQDEIVCEVGPHRKVEELQKIMENRPQWAIDIHLPIATEAWEGTRYRK